MRLTDIQVQGLRLAAGHAVEPLNPKNNSTNATLHKRGLLNPDGSLTRAGFAELENRHIHIDNGISNPRPRSGMSNNRVIAGKEAKSYIDRRRAKNRTARKSRRVNRQRAK
jgi:hypothetical protein